MNQFSIGVDLGGTNLRVAAVDRQGNLAEKISLETKVAMGRNYTIGIMCDAIKQMAAKYGADAPLLGVGIGVPGIIEKETGVVREAENLSGWKDYAAAADIGQRLGMEVILENDANVAALGEQWLGAAKEYRDMAMFTLGTGVGGGIVLGGSIWHGANGMAGEFGCATVEPDGPLCNCGNRGCLEQYASARAVIRLAHEAIARNGDSALAKAAAQEELSPKTIYKLAAAGDADAREVYRYMGRCLGIVLATFVSSLNLPIYVIGGGLASAWDAFAPAIFEELESRSMVYAATAPQNGTSRSSHKQGAASLVEAGPGHKTIITRALLGDDAGLYGAARLAMMAR